MISPVIFDAIRKMDVKTTNRVIDKLKNSKIDSAGNILFGKMIESHIEKGFGVGERKYIEREDSVEKTIDLTKTFALRGMLNEAILEFSQENIQYKNLVANFDIDIQLDYMPLVFDNVICVAKINIANIILDNMGMYHPIYALEDTKNMIITNVDIITQNMSVMGNLNPYEDSALMNIRSNVLGFGDAIDTIISKIRN